MTLVTVAEARENLPDLLRRAAAGEQIVITEDGRALAALGKPPVILTPEEGAARRAAATAAFHEFTEQMRKWCAEDGVPFLPDEPRAAALRPESPAA